MLEVETSPRKAAFRQIFFLFRKKIDLKFIKKEKHKRWFSNSFPPSLSLSLERESILYIIMHYIGAPYYMNYIVI